MEQSEIKLFEGQNIRYVWDEEKEQYFFSVVDVIQVLTESPRPRKYWNALKTKLQAEGSEVSQNMGQLKLPAPDGKLRLTDVATTEQLFRLIQSIPRIQRTVESTTDGTDGHGTTINISSFQCSSVQFSGQYIPA